MKVNANYTWLICKECDKQTKILPGQKFETKEDFMKLFECDCVEPRETAIEEKPMTEEEKEVGEIVAKAMIEHQNMCISLKCEPDEKLLIIAKTHNVKRASTMKRDTLIKRIVDAAQTI